MRETEIARKELLVKRETGQDLWGKVMKERERERKRERKGYTSTIL